MFFRRPAPRVVCFSTVWGLQPETEEALRRYAPHVEFVDTTGDEYTYSNRFEEVWKSTRASGKDLMTVEQDIVLTRNTIPSFRKQCGHDWCTYSYQGPPAAGFLFFSLGCTRFTASILDRYKFTDFYLNEDWSTGGIPWMHIDGRICRKVAAEDGLRPHVHGHVEHLHQYDRHPGGDQWETADKEWQADGTYIPICKELQIDGVTCKVYRVDERGKRGEYLRTIPPKVRFKS